MKIVFFTKDGFDANELFLYMYARVANLFPNCSIVAAKPNIERQDVSARIRRYAKKMRRLGWLEALDVISSYPLQMYLSERQQRETSEKLRLLPRPPVTIDHRAVRIVSTVNGPDAVETIRSLNPDILMQAGAGILRPQVFSLAKVACLNLHHGIAPLIRGMSSIHWALFERRPEWIGSTVHEIDANIDTGNVLAYAPVKTRDPGEGYPSLFTRATREGVDQLLHVLSRLESGERWKVPPMSGNSVYRSTMSGWKLAATALRLNGEKRSRVVEVRRGNAVR